MLRAITFDFWGTLYDGTSVALIRKIRLEEAMQSAGLRLADEDLQTAMIVSSEAGRRAWHEDCVTLSARQRLQVALDHLGVELPGETVSRLAAVWSEALLEQPPKPAPGIQPVLAALQEAGLPLGIISDTGITPGRVLRQVLAGDDLLRYFTFCAFSDEVGRTKPHEKPFRDTLAGLGGVEPGAAIHIGDLPRTDVCGAQRVGMKALLYTGISQRADDPCTADARFAHWADLVDTLTGVMGAAALPAALNGGKGR